MAQRTPHRLYQHVRATNGAPAQEAGQPSATDTKDQVNVRGIEIAGWTVESSRGSIANAAEMDIISDTLGVPAPEMTFPHNVLQIRHGRSGFTYTYDCVRALRAVAGVHSETAIEGLVVRPEAEMSQCAHSGDRKNQKAGIRGAIKVAYAKEWGKKREAPPSPESSGMTSSSTAPTTDGKSASPSTLSGASPFNFGPDVAAGISSIQSARDYDWTYSTTWPGFPSSSSASPSPTLGLSRTDSVQALLSPEEKPTPWFVPASDPGGRDRIPVEKLGAREPILFYDELVLFEDELADNGSSMVVVKVRVMPSGLLVLQRFFLRVDDVVFRVFDTRLYVAFEPDSPSTTAPAPAAAPAPGAFPIPTTASFTTSTARPGAAFPTATATARPGAPAPQPGATPAPWQRASGAATPTATARPGATQPTPTPAPTRTSIPTDQPDVSRLSLGPTRRATREAVAATATSAPFGAVPMRDSTGDASDAGEASQGRPEVRVIRECSGCEASYAEVKGRLPPYKPNDLSPLTDANWVSSTLQTLTARRMAQSSRGPTSTSLSPSPSLTAAMKTHAPGANVSPGIVGVQSARVLGELDGDDGEEETWDGLGWMVHVAVLS